MYDVPGHFLWGEKSSSIFKHISQNSIYFWSWPRLCLLSFFSWCHSNFLNPHVLKLPYSLFNPVIVISNPKLVHHPLA